MPTYNAEGHYNCNRAKCPHYQAVENRANPRKHDIPLTQVDRDHLFDDHLKTFALWMEEMFDKSLKRISELEKERDELKVQVEDLSAHVCTEVPTKVKTAKKPAAAKKQAEVVTPTTQQVQPAPTAQPITSNEPGSPHDLYARLYTGEPIMDAVDPSAHVEGFCNHLTTDGVCIYKCTDRARHGKNVCAMHLHSNTILKVTKNN